MKLTNLFPKLLGGKRAKKDPSAASSGGADGRKEGGRLRKEARDQWKQDAREPKPEKEAKGSRRARAGSRGGKRKGRDLVGAGVGAEAANGSLYQPDGSSTGYEYGSGNGAGDLDAAPAAPGSAGLGLPERIHNPKRDLGARAMALFVYVFAFVGLLWVMLAAFQGFFGGASSGPTAQANSGTAARDAEALAEPFAAAYLTMNAGENPSALRARVTPFVEPDLVSEVAPSGAENATRRVLSTGTVKATQERDGRWAVHTESVVETTVARNTEGSADDEAAGRDFRGSQGGQTTVERLGLMVYVGKDDAGGTAVVAPPLLVAPRPAYEGEGGAIYGEDGTTLYDGPVKSLLEGYFAAAYGTDESRSSLQNFMAEGGTVPLQPAPGIEFVSLKSGVLYPLSEAADPDWKEPYDVVAYVDVRDAATGGTYTQTHLLRVADTPDGWKVVGGEQVVASEA